MKSSVLVFGLVVSLCTVSIGEAYSAQRPNTPALIKRWIEANGYCRGGSGDDRETLAWCSVREGLSEVLAVRDWCYGKKDEYGYQLKWHRCVETSNKQTLPY